MARRRTGERIGAALEGFAGSFLPAYFGMQDIARRKRTDERLELADRQRYITSIGEQIRAGSKTEADLEPYIQTLMQNYDRTREEAITELLPTLPTREERVGQAFEGVDLTRATPEQMTRRAKQAGLPYGVYERRALPSTPILGGRQMDATGQLMAPLPQLPTTRPFVPGATGGPPPELTPFGKQFMEERTAAIGAEGEEQARLLGYETAAQQSRLETELDFRVDNVEKEIEVSRLMTEGEWLERNRQIKADGKDPELIAGLNAVAVALQSDETIGNFEIKQLERRNALDIVAVSEKLKMTQQPILDVYIDPETKEEIITVTWFSPDDGRVTITSLDDYPHMSPGMKLSLKNKFKWSPFMYEKKTVIEALIESFAPNLFNPDGSMNTQQLNQAQKGLVSELDMSPDEARNAVLSSRPQRGGDLPRYGLSSRPDVNDSDLKDQAVREIYGPNGDVVEELTLQRGQTRGDLRRQQWHQQAIALAQSDWIPNIDMRLEQTANQMRGIVPGHPEFEVRNDQYNRLSNLKQQLIKMIEVEKVPENLAPYMSPLEQGAWGGHPRNPAESWLPVRH
jgi:hypothetical protein